jgi:hypothetical protein
VGLHVFNIYKCDCVVMYGMSTARMTMDLSHHKCDTIYLPCIIVQLAQEVVIRCFISGTHAVKDLDVLFICIRVCVCTKLYTSVPPITPFFEGTMYLQHNIIWDDKAWGTHHSLQCLPKQALTELDASQVQTCLDISLQYYHQYFPTIVHAVRRWQ